MKKILSIMLVLCMLLSAFALTSCEFGKDDGDDDDDDKSDLLTAELVGNAIKATTEMKNLEAKIDVDITVSVTGMSMNVPIDALIRVDDDEASLDMEASIFGEKAEMKIYTDGEWVYMLEDGVGSKTPVTDDALGLDIPFGSIEDVMGTIDDIPEDALDKFDVKKNKDGDTELSVTMTKEDFPEVYEGIIQGLTETGNSVDEDDISNIDIVIVVAKGGYIKGVEMEFSVDMSIEGQMATVGMKLAFDIVKVDNVTVTPIPGCQSFPVEY